MKNTQKEPQVELGTEPVAPSHEKDNKKRKAYLMPSLALIGVLSSVIYFSTRSTNYQQNLLEAEKNYAVLRNTQQAELQKLVDKQLYELCVEEKEISRLKLKNIANGVRLAGDANTWVIKSNRDCDVLPGNGKNKPSSAVPVASAEIYYDGNNVEIEKISYNQNKNGNTRDVSNTVSYDFGYTTVNSSDLLQLSGEQTKTSSASSEGVEGSKGKESLPSSESSSTIQSQKDTKKFKVQVTSYNPEVAQNDASPCIAAGGHDICKLAKQGEKIIAVSRDLRKHFLTKQGQYFKYPAQVYVESPNPSIQGCYWVYDTMNARWRNRIDLFFMSRKDNQGDMTWATTITNDLTKCI